MEGLFTTTTPICEKDAAEVQKLCMKTGTTIVGVRFAGGVVLAADTRSTSGPIVADKNCEKIHYISNTIYACGAGTAADADRITRLAEREMALFECNFEMRPFVSHCARFLRNTLYEYGGAISAALVLGGCDNDGSHLITISPHGYINKEVYIAMGSGYYAAMGILESAFTPNMSKDDALQLAADAISAGILNDMYSGSNVDACIIQESGIVEMLRNYRVISAREDPVKLSPYPKNSIKITKEEVLKMVDIVDENDD